MLQISHRWILSKLTDHAVVGLSRPVILFAASGWISAGRLKPVVCTYEREYCTASGYPFEA
jgi:hypothetical protein